MCVCLLFVLGSRILSFKIVAHVLLCRSLPAASVIYRFQSLCVLECCCVCGFCVCIGVVSVCEFVVCVRLCFSEFLNISTCFVVPQLARHICNLSVSGFVCVGVLVFVLLLCVYRCCPFVPSDSAAAYLVFVLF